MFPRTDRAHKNHARPITENEKRVKHRPDINLMLSFQSVQNGCQQPQPMKLRNADKMSVCGY